MAKIIKLTEKLIVALKERVGFDPEVSMILYDRAQVDDVAEALKGCVSGDWKFLSNLLVLSKASDGPMVLLLGYEFAEVAEDA